MTAPAGDIQLISQNGEAKAFAPHEVAAAVASGKWGAPVGTQIPIAAGGNITTVPIEQLTETLRAQQAAVVSHKDLAEQQLQAQYGGIGDQIENAATNAVSGASLGLSDMAIGALASDKTREDIRKRAEANPIGTTASKVVGMAAPLLLSGGAAAPEEGAVLGGAEGAEALGLGGRALEAGRAALTAPTNVLTKVGDLAEAGVAKLLPEEASSVAGRLAVKAATTAARGTVEGVPIGASNYLGETALSQDQQFDGEKLWSSVGHGALLGGLTGGVLGAGGEGLSMGLEKASPKLSDAAESVLAKHVGIEDNEARTLLREGLIAPGDTLQTVAPKVAQAQEAVNSRLSELETKLDEVAPRGSGPSTEGLDKLWSMSVAPHLEESSPLQAIGQRIEQKAASAPADLQTFLNSPAGKAKLTEMIKSDPTIVNELQAGRIPKGLMPNAEEVATTTFDSAAKLRGAVDQALGQAAPGSPLAKGLGKLRTEIQDRIEDAQMSAKKALGDDHAWVKDFDHASELSEHLASTSEAIQKAVERPTATPLSGFGAMMAAAHIASHGIGLGALSGLATQIASKVVRARAPMAAALALDKLAAMGAIQRATSTVDAQITRGVAGAIRGRVGKLEGPLDHGLGSFEEKADAVRSAAEDMPAHLASLQQSVAAIAPHAPGAANSFVESAMRATQYLAAVMPKPIPSNPAMPKVDPIDPSEHDRDVFERTFDAVHDPVSVLKDMAQGTLVPEQVQAVRATAPKIAASIDAQLNEAMKNATRTMPLSQAIATSMWLNTPTDPALSPESMMMLQGNFATEPKGPPGAPPSKGAPKSSKLKIASMTSLSPQEFGQT